LILKPLFKPITPRNVDGTINSAGLITHYTWQTISIAEHKHRVRFLVTSLGRDPIILGLPWLRDANPDINWR
ncbi:hypothetical protein BJ138DRAFT_992633, partial [Hygrophoropsis aurantiaca]